MRRALLANGLDYYVSLIPALTDPQYIAGCDLPRDFDALPASCTLPPSIAVLANVRVLKKRAAHSHLSMRTLSVLSGLSVNCWQTVDNFVEMMDRRIARGLARRNG